MPHSGKSLRTEVVDCPTCSWPCRISSEEETRRTAQCPECGGVFPIDRPVPASELIKQKPYGNTGKIDREKVILPTRHTGNMREDRARKSASPDSEDPGVRDPDGHRLNPEKRTKLIPLSELVAEAEDGEEWRVDGLEKATQGDIAVKQWGSGQFVLVGIGLLLLVTLGMLGLGTQTEIDDSKARSDTASQVEELAELTTEIVGLTERFLAQTTIDGRLEMVRNPGVVREKMEDYYSREGNDRGLKIDGLPLATDVFTRDGSRFVGVVIDFNDLTRRGTIFQESGERWLLDWESFVGYSELDWEEFLAGKFEGAAQFRLLASSDDYFNFDFADTSVFACYKLTDIDSTATCWGYCERESEVGRLMARAVRDASKKRLPAAEVIVEIGFREVPRSRNQVWIEAFVSDTHLSL